MLKVTRRSADKDRMYASAVKKLRHDYDDYKDTLKRLIDAFYISDAGKLEIPSDLKKQKDKLKMLEMRVEVSANKCNKLKREQEGA